MAAERGVMRVMGRGATEAQKFVGCGTHWSHSKPIAGEGPSRLILVRVEGSVGLPGRSRAKPSQQPRTSRRARGYENRRRTRRRAQPQGSAARARRSDVHGIRRIARRRAATLSPWRRTCYCSLPRQRPPSIPLHLRLLPIRHSDRLHRDGVRNKILIFVGILNSSPHILAINSKVITQSN